MRRIKLNFYHVIIFGFLVLFLSLYIPFFNQGQDQWDGVAIMNALDSKDREIYWNWFSESGWFLVPLLYDVFFYLDLGYFSIIFSILVLHVATAFYIKKILKEIFGLDHYVALVGFLVFLLSPVWSVYVSTVFLMHSFTLFIAFYCIYNVLKLGFRNSYFYQILSLLSIQQASLPLLILGIFFYYMLVKKSIRSDFFHFIIYSLLISSIFFLTRFIFPAHGLYTGYNSIDLSRLINLDYYFIFHQFVSVVYPFYYIALLLFLLCEKSKLNAISLVFFVFLMIIPFVLVGKPAYPSHLFGIQGWDQRQAITLTPMLAIFFAFFYRIFSVSKVLIVRGIGIAIISLFILHSTFLLAKSLGFKYRSVMVQTALVKSVSNLNFENHDCAVAIKFDEGGNFKDLTQYEYSYIGKLAHGSSFLLYPIEANVPYFSEDIYRRKYIIPNEKKSCVLKYAFESNIAQLSFFDVYFGMKDHIYNLNRI